MADIRFQISNCRSLFLILVPLLLGGCFHETTELQPAHFAAAWEAGVLRLDVNMVVHTRDGELEYLFGDTVGPEETGTYLLGQRSWVERPDSIPLRDVTAVSYDADLEVLDQAGTKHDLYAGDWRIAYENGRPAAIAAGKRIRIPLDAVRAVTVYGDIIGISYVLATVLGLTAFVFFLGASGAFRM
ncbi:MAG: hypothetical protein RRA94_13250 [Bacteroidota bacterium]|nr:hypothetical protein [Bacteroidota bacterium]